MTNSPQLPPSLPDLPDAFISSPSLSDSPLSDVERGMLIRECQDSDLLQSAMNTEGGKLTHAEGGYCDVGGDCCCSFGGFWFVGSCGPGIAIVPVMYIFA